MIHHRATRTIALTLALGATVAPVASADPQPLAQPDAAIHTGTGPCSEVCAAGGYGSLNQPAASQTRTGATLPHDPRPRSVALANNAYGSVNVPARSPATTASCGDACSGGGYGPVTAPATAVRVVAHDGAFDRGGA